MQQPDSIYLGPRVLHFTSFLSLQPSPSCSRLCITAEYRLHLDPLGEIVHELIPSSLSNASFLERNKQAARACHPGQMFGITFTSLLHCMYFGGSQLMWNAASSVCLPPPLQAHLFPSFTFLSRTPVSLSFPFYSWHPSLYWRKESLWKRPPSKICTPHP